MTGPTATGSGSAPALARALATERRYFEMAAQVRPLPGATLAWMPAHAGSPAAAVIHRADAAAIARLGSAWVDAAQQALADAGIRLARIYLNGSDEAADALLRGAGFTSRRELVFVASLTDAEADLALVAVASEEDWARKRVLHEAADSSPDGHATIAADWVAIERAKCAHGMNCFLAERDGAAIGAVSAIWGEGMLRFKNLVVHPAYRRTAVASALLARLAAFGRQRGYGEQCALALAGESGEKLYRALGMAEVGSQIEWSRCLSGDKGAA
jgi:ribosomal protein S18 acetylase RimI-like enzyme